MKTVIVRSLGFDVLQYIDDYIEYKEDIKYYDISRLSLRLPFTTAYATLFNLGEELTGSFNPRMIHLEDEDENCYMVTDLRVVNNGSSRILEVGASSMIHILNFRVMRASVNVEDQDIGMLSRQITSNAIGDDSYPERSLGRVVTVIPPNLGITGSLSVEIGEKVGDALMEFFEQYEYGVRIVPNYSEDRFELQAYIGADRTEATSNPKIFSDEAENVSQISYEQDVNNFANTALMRVFRDGDQNPANNYDDILFASSELIDRGGWSRREVFGNGRDISNKFTTFAGMEIDLPYSAHFARVRRAGRSFLDGLTETRNMDATLSTSENFEFNKDFFVGDRVTMVMFEAGVISQARITNATRTINKDGETIRISVGSKRVSLLKEIKKGLRNLGISR